MACHDRGDQCAHIIQRYPTGCSKFDPLSAFIISSDCIDHLLSYEFLGKIDLVRPIFVDVVKILI